MRAVPQSNGVRTLVDLNWEVILANEVWEDGKFFAVVDSSYRHRTVIHCSSTGRQRALFANGRYPYAAYIELIDSKGVWNSHAVGMVPVLPDGRLLMVVEQRPPQGRFEQITEVTMGGQTIDLTEFGPYSSLEFPGGAVDKEDKTFKAGFLRELEEETGASPQGIVYMARHVVHPMVSDMALGKLYGVIYLSGMHFDNHTKSDGGLHVFALTPDEVWQNFYTGKIRSGNAALLNWLFYNEIEKMRKVGVINEDFVTVETVTLKKT
ncbi:NUDIX domain-containing protein [Candidatus Nomurabacteria bacterium]|nr:NUDIX domain-containing protein [Candidatus Nomurabacteria bacterium]